MAKLTPHDWQLVDQAKLAKGNHTGLVAIEAGGGKSLTATLSLKAVQPDVTLIVAPQSTHKTAWIPTLRDNIDVDARIIGNGRKAEKDAMFDFNLRFPGTYLVTPQLLARGDVSDWAGDFCVIDESHQVATYGSKAQRALSGATPSEAKNALATRFEHRLALSGTPMRQSFTNLWGTMRFLYPHLSAPGQIADLNHFMWQAERMNYENVVTGFEWLPIPYKGFQVPEGAYKKVIDGVPHYGMPKTVKKYFGESTPGRLLSEIPTVIMHKRRETCCSEPTHQGGFLPTEEPQVIERTVELTPKQKRAIREMDTQMMTWIEDNPLVADISLTQKQRIRQLTLAEATVEEYEADGQEKTRIKFDLNAKSPVADEVNHILSNLPDDEPVVVYTDSQIFAEVLAHQIDRAAEYSGVRKADLTRLGKDYRVLVGTVASIGTGTAGLNHVASTEIFADQPVSLTMLTQASSRLDRLDSSKRVQRYILLDDCGVQNGRMEDLWMKQVQVARSMRIGTGTKHL